MRILLIAGKLFVNDERLAIGRRDSKCFYAITELEIFIYYALAHIYTMRQVSAL